MEFNIGDTVVCVDGSYRDQERSHLTTNCCYTVFGLELGRIIVLNNGGKYIPYQASRFRKCAAPREQFVDEYEEIIRAQEISELVSK